MSQQIRDARLVLDRVLKHPDNLLLCHTRQGRGRRWQENALNHAAVFLVVAAWQAFVEATAEAIRDTIRPPAGSPLLPRFNLVNADFERTLKRYNTPNAYNTVQLLSTLGFDPTPSWTWPVHGLPRSAASIANELGMWLEVRHALAHGSNLPPLAVVTGFASGVPNMRRTDAVACRQFFVGIADATRSGADAQFP